jgi:hypothetical protein
MEPPHPSSLIEALQRLPALRQARGKQLEWTMILGLIATAIVCQQWSAALGYYAGRSGLAIH